MMTTRLLLLFVAMSGSALAAPGETEAVAAPASVHVGLHAGIVLPQLGSELEAAGGATLEAGLRVWRGLVPFVAVGYAQPVVEGSADDPRLSASSYTTTVTQRELTLTLGALWRQQVGGRVGVLVGGGARAYLLESVATGSSGGEPFLETRETSTRWGAVGLVGGELRLGPGAAAVTLEVGGSSLPHVITGDVSTAAASVQIGYRVFFR